MKKEKQSKKKRVALLIEDEQARKILTEYAGLLASEYDYTAGLSFGDVPTGRVISSRHFDDVRGSLLLRGLHEVCDELQRRHDARVEEWRLFVTAAEQAPTEAREAAHNKWLYPAGLEGYGDQYQSFWKALEPFQRGISSDYAFIVVDLLGENRRIEPKKRTTPLYPTDTAAIEILTEGVKRHNRPKHKGASWRDIALSLLEQERTNGTRPYWARMMNQKKGAEIIFQSNDKRVQNAATNWGKYLSYYSNRSAK